MTFPKCSFDVPFGEVQERGEGETMRYVAGKGSAPLYSGVRVCRNASVMLLESGAGRCKFHEEGAAGGEVRGMQLSGENQS